MTTSIANVLITQQNDILQEWVRHQLSSESMRADPISEADLRIESDRFLEALLRAVQSGNINDIHALEYKPVDARSRRSNCGAQSQKRARRSRRDWQCFHANFAEWPVQKLRLRQWHPGRGRKTDH